MDGKLSLWDATGVGFLVNVSPAPWRHAIQPCKQAHGGGIFDTPYSSSPMRHYAFRHGRCAIRQHLIRGHLIRQLLIRQYANI